MLIGFPDKETGWDESWRGRVPLRTAPGLTDIGGNAFRTNSIEVRGISRMAVSTFDTSAAVRKEIFVAAT